MCLLLRRNVDTDKSEMHDRAPVNFNINRSGSEVKPTKGGIKGLATGKKRAIRSWACK